MGRIGRIAIVWILIFTAAAQGEGMYIRVVSRDDSIPSQLEKFMVRDAVLPLIPEDEEKLEEQWDEIVAAADSVAPCYAEIRPWGPEGMPVRETVYITLGEGNGPNWWGILWQPEWADQEEVSLYWPWLTGLLNWLGLS